MAAASKTKQIQKTAASRCWSGYEPTPGKAPYSNDSCRPIGSKKTEKKEKKADYKPSDNYLQDAPVLDFLGNFNPLPTGHGATVHRRAGGANYLQSLAGEENDPDLQNPAWAKLRRGLLGGLLGAGAGGFAGLAGGGLTGRPVGEGGIIGGLLGLGAGTLGGLGYDAYAKSTGIASAKQKYDDALAAGKLKKFELPTLSNAIIQSGAADQGAVQTAEAIQNDERPAGSIGQTELNDVLAELAQIPAHVIAPGAGVGALIARDFALREDAKKRRQNLRQSTTDQKPKTKKVANGSATQLPIPPTPDQVTADAQKVKAQQAAAEAARQKSIQDSMKLNNGGVLSQLSGADAKSQQLDRQLLNRNYKALSTYPGMISTDFPVSAAAPQPWAMSPSKGSAPQPLPPPTSSPAVIRTPVPGRVPPAPNSPTTVTATPRRPVLSNQKQRENLLLNQLPATREFVEQQPAVSTRADTPQQQSSFYDQMMGYAPYALGAGGIGLAGLLAYNMLNNRRRRDDDEDR